MQTTPKLGLKKPDLNDYVNVADLNDNADILDAAVGGAEDSLTTHLAESMPHQFIEGAKTYKWGFRVLSGKPQFIYEEVL